MPCGIFKKILSFRDRHCLPWFVDPFRVKSIPASLGSDICSVKKILFKRITKISFSVSSEALVMGDMTLQKPSANENRDDKIGKVAIVTGANSGIGYETARSLARRGFVVILACRDISRGEESAGRIRSELPRATCEAMNMDLSSFRSVRDFCKDFKGRYNSLHLLINNAGVWLAN